MSLTLPSLPDGWSWATVADVGATSEQAVLTGPFGTSLGPDDFVAETASAVPVLTIGCLREAGIDLRKATFVTPVKAMELERYRLRAGDILFSRMATVGRAGLVRATQEAALFNYHIMRLRLRDDAIDPLFFIYYVRSSEVVRAYVRSVNHGMTRDGINTEQLVSMPLPIAPRNQQRRIVEAIEDVLSRLEAAVANLEAAQRKLKAYRASVLKAAVEGRLVPTEADLARKEGRSYEPADVLLQRILKERRRRWEEAELAKLKTAGKAQKDDKWKAKYEEPESLDSSTLPRLPDGWCWAPASALYWDAGYGTSVKCVEDGTGPAVLRIPNIVEGRVDLEDLKFAVDDAALRSNDRVQPGDFLFIRTNGSRSLIGKGALVLQDNASPLFFASYLIRLRLVTVDSCDRWFALAWSGPQVREQVLRVAASSAGQHNVSLSAASSFAIPFPPAAEQARIVEEFERLDTGTAVVDHEISAGEKRCSRLRQAVVKWAFEGRLVDQDPTDEPASMLLSRIRAERETAAPTATKGTRSRKLKAAS
jgi:type I restriction enzyme S subunit